MTRRQSLFMVTFIAFLLTLTVGYALFSENIKIEGTVNAKGNFDMQFYSAEIEEVGSTGATAIISDDGNTLDINIPKLEYPGAYVSIDVTVVNKGSIPAVLYSTSISSEFNELGDDGLYKRSLFFEETGIDEIKDVVMNQNDTRTFNIKVGWYADSTQQVENEEFSVTLNYMQAN